MGAGPYSPVNLDLDLEQIATEFFSAANHASITTKQHIKSLGKSKYEKTIKFDILYWVIHTKRTKAAITKLNTSNERDFGR